MGENLSELVSNWMFSPTNVRCAQDTLCVHVIVKVEKLVLTPRAVLMSAFDFLVA